MLVLSRQRDEQIVVEINGQPVYVTIVDIRGDKVRLGVEAPTNVSVHRTEIFQAIQRENLQNSKRLERSVAQTPIVKPQPIQEIVKPQETSYQKFVKYLKDGNFTEAGRIYDEPSRGFEASHQELDELSKGLYKMQDITRTR